VTGNHGVLTAKLGEIEKAIELTDEAYRLCRGVGDVSLTALWLSNLAGYALEGGNTAEARRRLDESLELARLIDDSRGTGGTLATFGWVELLEGNFEHAFSCFEEAAAIGRRLGARWLGVDALWASPKSQPQAATPIARRASRGPRSRSVSIQPAWLRSPFDARINASPTPAGRQSSSGD
jgi:tetratricopeptide (TPR) repeat protein